MNTGNGDNGERFTGHGSEWRDSNLSPEDAQTATAWVEQVINKRSMEVNKDRVEDVRDAMWELETATGTRRFLHSSFLGRMLPRSIL